MSNHHEEQIRIVQETVAGKEITFAHVMGGPAPIVYQKLGLNPQVDYRSSAIGIMNMTPPESAVIASDIAVKSGNIYLGFADRFTGTLIITGGISDVMSALTEVVTFFSTPWESVVVAADVAMKSADVEIGFMDRFCGSLILTGGLSQVQTAVEEVVRFFDEELGFRTCEIHKN